jgi:HD-GYP domain-containing protein (c-di-GMP phosphodiesterase class II)/DNA-binding CsgD family transcriptional regulator
MAERLQSDSGVRRAEIIACLSLATDLAMGQGVGRGLKSCLLGVRLGRLLGLVGEELREIYYHSLLRFIGCNAETYALAALFGDEIDFRREFALVDAGDGPTILRLVARHVRGARAGAPFRERTWGVLRAVLAAKGESAAVIEGHCEVAERLADRLGFGAGVIRNLGQIYERWDGRGLPQGLKGEAVAIAVRAVNLCQDALVLAEAHGADGALGIVRERGGKAYDPRMADALCRSELLAGVGGDASWEEVLDFEPEPQTALSPSELDAACLAIADFTDIKTPYALGHSRAVAALAAAAVRRAGLPQADAVDLYRAGLVHDVGQVAVPAAIFVKAGPLAEPERERMRLHTYYTERVLARPAPLAKLAAIAGRHHERLDGTGYHRGARGQELSLPARILAAAEAYRAMTEERPYRAALSPEQAAAALRSDVRAGRFDGEAVDAVLDAAGQRVAEKRKSFAAGLTSREIEVLRLVARGHSAKEMARRLGISAKTVDNHVQNLYGKIGVSTRAGATLFAIEHGLTGPEARF